MNPRAIAVVASIWIILTAYSVVSGNLNIVQYANAFLVVLFLILLSIFTIMTEND